MKKQKFRCIILGDVHGRFTKILNPFMRYLCIGEPETLFWFIQLGDLNYWPIYGVHPEHLQIYGDGFTHKCIVGNRIDSIDLPTNAEFFFLAGNHEHWDELDKLTKNQTVPYPIELRKRLWYCPSGSILAFPNRSIGLFVSGADSIDKGVRKPGVDWFPQEVSNGRFLEEIPENTPVDYLFSHTCGTEEVTKLLGNSPVFSNDFTWKILDEVIERFQPHRWFFAHWHMRKYGIRGNTPWHCLNMAPNEGWWMEL